MPPMIDADGVQANAIFGIKKNETKQRKKKTRRSDVTLAVPMGFGIED